MYILYNFKILQILLVNYPLLTFSFLIVYIFYKYCVNNYYYLICQYYLYNIDRECTICLETCKLNLTNPNCVLLKCNHVFHLDCLKKWIMSGQENYIKCPLCRTNLLNEKNRLF